MSCCKIPVLCAPSEMNIPFQTFWRPIFRKNCRSFRNICSFPLLNLCFSYTGFLGLFGMGLCLFDIIRVIKCGSVLPFSLVRSRIQAGKVVTPECERDLKLISLVLSLEYYLFLVIGTLTQSATLFIPWLVLYGFIISIEFVVFLCRLFFEGYNVTKHSLVLSMFVIFNWLVVFCIFFRLSNSSCIY